MASIEENIQRLGGLRPDRGGPFIPMPEAEAETLERTIGTRLPESYRNFLTACGAVGFNGYVYYTSLEPLRPYIAGDTKCGHFGIFYGAAANDEYSVAENLDTYRDRMPEVLIPIGEDGGGNQICLGIAGAELGRIYFWDHEDEWDEENYTSRNLPIPPNLKFRNVHLIANSFEEFFDQMFVREDV